MGRYANEVINQAKAWIGKKESNGSHKEIIDIYNTQKPLPRNYKVKYSDSWCATFVSAVAIKLGYTTIIPPECGCERMIELFRALDCWIENENYTPAPGDIIFYDWQDSGKGDNKGWSDHVGIVEKVSGGKITVIEGNYSDAVKRRSLEVNGKYIRGYGVPRYDKEPVKIETPEELYRVRKTWADVKTQIGAYKVLDNAKAKADENPGYKVYDSSGKCVYTSGESSKKSVDELAREVIAGKWGVGLNRKRKLTEAGYNYSEVQKRVNEILK